MLNSFNIYKIKTYLYSVVLNKMLPDKEVINFSKINIKLLIVSLDIPFIVLMKIHT